MNRSPCYYGSLQSRRKKTSRFQTFECRVINPRGTSCDYVALFNKILDHVPVTFIRAGVRLVLNRRPEVNNRVIISTILRSGSSFSYYKHTEHTLPLSEYLSCSSVARNFLTTYIQNIYVNLCKINEYQQSANTGIDNKFSSFKRFYSQINTFYGYFEAMIKNVIGY